MHLCGRSIVAFLLVFLSLMPGAHSVSIGGGTSATISGGSSVEGNLATDGLNTQAFVSSAGTIDSLNLQHWVTNTVGDHVDVGVTATNAAGFTYNYATSPGEGNVGSSNAVSAQQWLSANSADSLNAYSRASNSAGDSAGADLTLKYGSLGSYYSAAYAGPATWLGIERGAFVQQIANNAKGNSVLAMTWAANPVQDATGTSTEVKNGALNVYSAQANAVKYSNGPRASGVLLNSVSASAPGGSILQIINTYDNKGDRSKVSTSIANGNLAGDSWAYSIGQWGVAESNQNINAKGSVIDVGAYAENSKPGYEYRSFFDGTVKYYTALHGDAQFEYKTSNQLAANVNSRATTDNVLITPSLPAGTKTAIMLEPMYYAFTTVAGATDLGPTVARTLVEKEYAVLRYTDSGASIDKFRDLDNYNVALVTSHMDNQYIALSTSPGDISAAQIDSWYSNPPSNSLVILAGCEPLGGFPSRSPLANAVREASTVMGFSDTVEMHWCNDYLSVLIKKMGEGMTVEDANNYVWGTYRPNWLAAYGYPTRGIIPLNGFGNKDFKL